MAERILVCRSLLQLRATELAGDPAAGALAPARARTRGADRRQWLDRRHRSRAAIDALPLLGATSASVVRNRNNYNLGAPTRRPSPSAERSKATTGC